MTWRADNNQDKYINNASVAASGTTTGEKFLMTGCLGLSVQCIATGGAAGTLFVEGTNQQGNAATVTWGAAQSVSVAANGSAYMNFSLADQLTGMHAVRCRFVSSAAGNVTVSINARRMATA